ncbi:hypothetical protein MHYP_G00363540 [Metynnis hypsauchen]
MYKKDDGIKILICLIILHRVYIYTAYMSTVQAYICAYAQKAYAAFQTILGQRFQQILNAIHTFGLSRFFHQQRPEISFSSVRAAAEHQHQRSSTPTPAELNTNTSGAQHQHQWSSTPKEINTSFSLPEVSVSCRKCGGAAVLISEVQVPVQVADSGALSPSSPPTHETTPIKTPVKLK